MLCDSWLKAVHELHRSDTKGRSATSPDMVPDMQLLKRAQRYVIAPDAARVIAELSAHASAPNVRGGAITPADVTWVEWSDPVHGAVGVLLNCANPGQPGRAGQGVLVTNGYVLTGRKQPVPIPIRWDFADAGPVLRLLSDRATLDFYAVACPDLLGNLDIQGIGDRLVAALSLIAAPRLIEVREPDFEKLNKQRRRLGRPEFLPHREITLALGEENQSAQSAQSDLANEDVRVGRALHHVRAHYRLIPGKVALVRQHWRGDARLGVTSQLHTIRTTKDGHI